MGIYKFKKYKIVVCVIVHRNKDMHFKNETTKFLLFKK